jgi:hypothetical protein
MDAGGGDQEQDKDTFNALNEALESCSRLKLFKDDDNSWKITNGIETTPFVDGMVRLLSFVKN